MPRLQSAPNIDNARTDLDQHGNVIESASESAPKARRSNRAMESRAREGRIASAKAPVSYMMGSRFNLPEQLVENLRKSGYEPGWIAYSRAKVEDKENYFDAVDREYQPIMASEAPELSRKYDLNPFGSREEDTLIRRGGQILMKRPIEAHLAEQQHYNEIHMRQQQQSDLFRQSPNGLTKFLDERTLVPMR